MRKIHLSIILISTIFFGCECLYPIKTQLIDLPTSPSSPWVTIDFNPKNMYQLRINEKIEALVEYKKSIDGIHTLVSDAPFKRFQQDIKPQQLIDDAVENIRIDETYLYLDNLNNIESQISGIAMYFITYPIVEEDNKKYSDSSKTRFYFNDISKLYFNTIRSIQIGKWYKNKNNELVLLFKNDFNNTISLIGKLNKTKDKTNNLINTIGFTKVSHPSRLVQRKLKTQKLYTMDVKDNKDDSIINKNIDMYTNELINKIVYIDLDKVIDLNGKKSLLFFQIPDGKKVIHLNEKMSKKDNIENLNRIFVDDSSVKFKFSTTFRDSIYYRFKLKNVHFLDSLNLQK